MSFGQMVKEIGLLWPTTKNFGQEAPSNSSNLKAHADKIRNNGGKVRLMAELEDLNTTDAHRSSPQQNP